MSFETWLAFAAASVVLLVIPGPTILLVISYALGQGAAPHLPVATGVALGDFTAITLSMLGAGALLATSAELFTLLKWVGGGLPGLARHQAAAAVGGSARSRGAAAGRRGRMIAHAWIVTALNPKGITFFVAFLPQFLDPARDLLDADGDLRGDIPRPRHGQCVRLCRARPAGRAASSEAGGA